MYTKSTIYEIVKKELVSYKHVDARRIKPNADLDTLLRDSLGLVEFVMHMEHKCNFTISDTDDRWTKIRTVNQLVDYITEYKNQKNIQVQR